MKAITGLEMLFMGLIGTFTIIVGGLIPSSTVKLTEEKQIIFEQNYNKVQLVLLNLLSTTNDNKKVYESIAENIAVKSKPSLEFLKEYLDKLAGKCYKLTTVETIPILGPTDTDILVSEEKDCQFNYFANATIVLPYNPDKLIKELKVGIG